MRTCASVFEICELGWSWDVFSLTGWVAKHRDRRCADWANCLAGVKRLTSMEDMIERVIDTFPMLFL